MCCGGKNSARTRLHFLVLWNTSHQCPNFLCCRGKIQRIPSDVSACCGTLAYDTILKMCCSGKIQRVPAAISFRCRTRAYDAQQYLCFDGTSQLTNLLVAGSTPLTSNGSCVVVVQYSPSHLLFPHTCSVMAQYKTSHLAVPRVAGPEPTTSERTGAECD